MNAPGPAEGRGAVEAEAEYFQTIEESFVAQRGEPLILSNAEWLLVRRWRKGGIPLRVVLRGIRDALDAHAHSFDRQRKVGSLRYCEREVGAAFERWHRALGTGAERRAGLAERLKDLGRALEARCGLPAALATQVGRLVAGLAERAATPADTAGLADPLEAWLLREERALVRVAAAALPEGERGAIAEEIERDLAPYRGRMPEGVLSQVRQESLTRRFLERWGLPRLTLLQGE